MRDKAFSRSELLLGKENMEVLRHARVAVFGIGGVGGYVVEALARSGVGALDLIDNDVVEETNLNRQIIATRSTLGQDKVKAAERRVLDINPDCQVKTYKTFYLPENAQQFDFTKYSYVVDAIDTVSGKLCLVEQAKEAKVPIISAMGAGNKLDPLAFKVADIYDTRVCPLAKVMRRELKKRGIDSLKVVYSEELPVNRGESELPLNRGASEMVPAPGRRSTPGSISFVPSVVGLVIAGEIIKDLCDFSLVKR